MKRAFGLTLGVACYGMATACALGFAASMLLAGSCGSALQPEVKPQPRRTDVVLPVKWGMC